MAKNILSIFSGRKVTGLYIAPNTIDLVILKKTLKGPRLIKFAQVPIYPKKEGVDEEIIPAIKSSDEQGVDSKKTREKTRDDYIVEAIKRLFKENKLKPCNVITAIPSEEAMVRYFQMPRIPKQEWHSAINFEAKRYIPFRIEDVASDYQVIQSKTSPRNMDVVFTAVKENNIGHLINLLEKAGLRPVIIEPTPFSFMRAFNAAEQISRKINTAIVNINERAANITILRRGIPYIIRDIPLERDNPEDPSIEPMFERLLAEIKLSFDFYEKQFPSEVIDKIIIYSHVPLENWHELVGKELQIPVEVGDPLRGIRVKKGVVPPGLAIAFGLALRGISESFIDINLYKERMLVYKRKELFLRTIFLEASVAIFVLIILKILCIKAISPLRDELDRTLSERPKIEVGIKGEKMAELERAKNKISSEKDLMENIISHRTYFTSRLKELARLTPSNIWLTELSFEEREDKKDISRVIRRFDIKGYCLISRGGAGAGTVNNFLMDLKENDDIKKGLSKANIISVKKTEIENEEVAGFEILFTGP